MESAGTRLLRRRKAEASTATDQDPRAGTRERRASLDANVKELSVSNRQNQEDDESGRKKNLHLPLITKDPEIGGSATPTGQAARTDSLE